MPLSETLGQCVTQPCEVRAPSGIPTVQNRLEFDHGSHEVVNKMAPGRLRIAMSRSQIRIGCTLITPEAAEWILKQYRERFDVTEPELVIQP